VDVQRAVAVAEFGWSVVAVADSVIDVVDRGVAVGAVQRPSARAVMGVARVPWIPRLLRA
jgi:hypothetical protein